MVDAAAGLEIEAIKQLKARYCRYLDFKDWAAWRDLLADEFTSEIAGAGGRRTVGAEQFVVYTRQTIGRPSQTTVHQVHAPEITLTSSTTACGIWALNDVVCLIPAVTLHGYGHYHETYVNIGGRWRIKSLTLTRVREDVRVPPLPPLPQWVAKRLRVVAAKIARGTSRLHRNRDS